MHLHRDPESRPGGWALFASIFGEELEWTPDERMKGGESLELIESYPVPQNSIVAFLTGTSGLWHKRPEIHGGRLTIDVRPVGDLEVVLNRAKYSNDYFLQQLKRAVR